MPLLAVMPLRTYHSTIKESAFENLPDWHPWKDLRQSHAARADLDASWAFPDKGTSAGRRCQSTGINLRREFGSGSREYFGKLL